MVVQHNLTAMNANRYLGINNSKLSKSLEKLSSGYAINRAGDNAAGLAVSEKMRSQIAGMTQAVKNAQDGISMVQTFEGALTETDSILQRMKTLANQMANGSYDDPVDRTAAQQEFLQLNDELDQIADTDFNGVVVLNGGVMADGARAEGVTLSDDPDGALDGYGNVVQVKSYNSAAAKAGSIDYKDWAKKKAAADDGAKAAATAQKAALQKQIDNLVEPKALTVTDIDEVAYNKAAADSVWESLGITADQADEVTVTFTATKGATGAVTWKATKADAKKGANAADVTIGDTQLAKITAAASSKAAGTGEGGISISSAGGGTVGEKTDITNVIFDATNVNTGDVVAVKFTNVNEKTYAPKNVGFTDNSGNELDGKFSYNHDAKIELVDALTDDTMNQDWKKALDALQGLTIKVSYPATDKDAAPTAADVKVSLDGTTVVGGTWTIEKKAGEENVYEIKTGDTAIGGIAAETTIATFTAETLDNVKALDTTTAPTVATYGIKIENYSAADPTKVPDAAKGTAVADKTAYNAQKKALQDQIAELDKTIEKYNVSVSDAFENSKAQLTYKDSITLQVGARTKDAVNFTFKYKSNAIGDLKANLDCTANGLGTDKLNLSSQKAANYAIDKIDQAINKVSLVRGTFGAIQNRLEHKIDNLNVSVENLTSAESQIRDTNMPQEMMNFTKQQILAQASQSMLAQANQLPQGVLSLLQ